MTASGEDDSKIMTQSDLVEARFVAWEESVDEDDLGYRGHAYRIFNFCLATSALI
jgi:hypothetical protein